MKKLSILCLNLCLALIAIAQPQNDLCENATPVSIHKQLSDCLPLNLTFIDATKTKSNTCTGYTDFDVWVSFNTGDVNTIWPRLRFTDNGNVIIKPGDYCSFYFACDSIDAYTSGQCEADTIAGFQKNTDYIMQLSLPFYVEEDIIELCLIGIDYNDKCEDAHIATLDSNISFSTALAETDGPWDRWAQMEKDIWYTFTAPKDSTYRISTCGSSFSSVISLYDFDDCSMLSQYSNLHYNNNYDDCIPNDYKAASIVFNGKQGESFLIRIGGDNDTQFGSGNLLITYTESIVRPENNYCVDAFAMEIAPNADSCSFTTFNVKHATSEHGDNYCKWTSDPSIWFRFNSGDYNAVQPKMFTIIGQEIPADDYAFSWTIFSDCETIDTVASDRCWIPLKTRLKKNTDYWLSFTPPTGFPEVDVNLCLEAYQYPEICEIAEPITVGETLWQFTSYYSETSGIKVTSSKELYADMWYSFTAPKDTAYRIETCSPWRETKIAVYATDNCTAITDLSHFAYSNNLIHECGNQTDDGYIEFNGIKDQHYYFRLGSTIYNDYGEGDITVLYKESTPNDFCENAMPVELAPSISNCTPKRISVSNATSTFGGGSSCEPNLNSDMWFSLNTENYNSILTLVTNRSTGQTISSPINRYLTYYNSCNEGDAFFMRYCDSDTIFGMTRNRDYLFKLSIPNSWISLDLEICFIGLELPWENDACEDAESIEIYEQLSTATTKFSGSEPLLNNNKTIVKDQWHVINIPTTEPYIIMVCSEMDTVAIALYEANVCSEIIDYSEIAYSDNGSECELGSTYSSEIKFDAKEGTNYYIRTGVLSEDNDSYYQLSVYPEEPVMPVNDFCENAIKATVASSTANCTPTEWLIYNSTKTDSGAYCLPSSFDSGDTWFQFNSGDYKSILPLIYSDGDLITYYDGVWQTYYTDCNNLDTVTSEQCNFDTITGFQANTDYWLKLTSLQWTYGNQMSMCLIGTETHIGIEEDKTTSFDFQLFPNPTNEDVNIKFQKEDDYTIEIYNLSGQLVYNSSFIGTSQSLTTSQLPSGVYALKARSNKDIETKMLIIE